MQKLIYNNQKTYAPTGSKGISKKYVILLILLLVILLFGLFYFLTKTNKNRNKEPLLLKGNINDCYAIVMSSSEEDILNKLIDVWIKVSNKAGIRWSVCAGTYIGLIRHKERIPWDDDFDVTIMKEDLPKLKNIDQLLSKYNVSLVQFWGGYKIFFNDYRAITKFPQYGWNWPFIDIFAVEKDINNRVKMECFFLEKEELPLVKKKFGKQQVYVYQNPSKERGSIKKQNWRKSLLDTGYRHQKENGITNKCKEIPIKLN